MTKALMTSRRQHALSTINVEHIQDRVTNAYDSYLLRETHILRLALPSKNFAMDFEEQKQTQQDGITTDVEATRIQHHRVVPDFIPIELEEPC
jgi:hypothetical protein